MIDVADLTVSYDAEPVLRGVTFTAAAGEVLGVVGPNGAGKSTLLKAIWGWCQLTRPSRSSHDARRRLTGGWASVAATRPILGSSRTAHRKAPVHAV
nr:ATP-binding cassette domain-containing protein [Euzebyaceae bacterium]